MEIHYKMEPDYVIAGRMKVLFTQLSNYFVVNTSMKRKQREEVLPLSLEYKPASPPNPWTEHINVWRKENGMDYWKAARHPDCKKAYAQKNAIKKRGKND